MSFHHGSALAASKTDSLAHHLCSWRTATECHNNCDPTIDTHYYYDTKIVLETGIMSYGSTVGAGGDASFSDFTPNEDGSVWTIAKITIPAMNKNSPSGDQGVAGYVAPAGNSIDTSATVTEATSASVTAADPATTPALCVSSAASTVTEMQTLTQAAATQTETQVRKVAVTKTLTKTVTRNRRSIPTRA